MKEPEYSYPLNIHVILCINIFTTDLYYSTSLYIYKHIYLFTLNPNITFKLLSFTVMCRSISDTITEFHRIYSLYSL